MSDNTQRKTTRTIIIAGVIAIAFLYFIVYPNVLFLFPPKDESISMTNKLKLLHVILLLYNSDHTDNCFPTKSDLKFYDNKSDLSNNDDITLLGNSSWLAAGQEDSVVAVSRVLDAVPSPSSYGCFFFAIRLWPSTDIPERRLQLHANGKITVCPVVDSKNKG